MNDGSNEYVNPNDINIYIYQNFHYFYKTDLFTEEKKKQTFSHCQSSFLSIWSSVMKMI